MTITALAKTIKNLPTEDQAKLFDKLAPALEDYLLMKIAMHRIKKKAAKRPTK